MFENQAHRRLALHRNPRIPQKASAFIPDLTKFRYRSDFQENIRDLTSVLLDEVEDNEDLKSEFYAECYVPLEANNRHLLWSKKVVRERYRRVAMDGIKPSDMIDSAASTSAQATTKDKRLPRAVSAKPIVVIGDVGVGKTSFFENIHESLDKKERENTYFIHVNLGISANLSDDVRSYILEEIPSVLGKRYGKDIFEADFVESIYYEEIRSFNASVRGAALRAVDESEYAKERIKFLSDLVDNKGNHLQASLGHLSRGQGRHIVLVIDNADQRSFAVQQEAFLIAQELATTRNITVFVALRPSTFYTSKMSGALAAYQNKVLTISPPPADEVVQKRLRFAVNVAEGRVRPEALEGVRLELGNVVNVPTSNA